MTIDQMNTASTKFHVLMNRELLPHNTVIDVKFTVVPESVPEKGVLLEPVLIEPVSKQKAKRTKRRK